MKIAIIGAGFTGLAAAYELQKKGHNVTIIEKDSQPGGLALGYQEKEWDWSLELFYHHWFTNDNAILNLAREIDHSVITTRPKTSSLIEDVVYQLDSPYTLLSFKKLSLSERMQMGCVLAFLRYNPFWKPFERLTAAEFLKHTIGKRAYKLLWEPLLVAKFGNYADQIALTWFWARVRKRTTSLSYPKGGFLHFAKHLSKVITNNDGKFLYNTDVILIQPKTSSSSSQKKENIPPSQAVIVTYKSRLGTGEITKKSANSIQINKTTEYFDKVIVTLPSFIFSKLAPSLPLAYQQSLLNLKGIGAVVLVMRLKKAFFTDGTYWLNVCDTKAPILAIVEHTNFMDMKHYNNEHIVYLGNYLQSTHKYFSMSESQIMSEFDSYLKKLNPEYKKYLIGVRKFSTVFAQPVFFKNYSNTIPPFTTPLPNIYLANMQQVYPWDRGTNYAVELGQKVANFVTKAD